MAWWASSGGRNVIIDRAHDMLVSTGAEGELPPAGSPHGPDLYKSQLTLPEGACLPLHGRSEDQETLLGSLRIRRPWGAG